MILVKKNKQNKNTLDTLNLLTCADSSANTKKIPKIKGKQKFKPVRQQKTNRFTDRHCNIQTESESEND